MKKLRIFAPAMVKYLFLLYIAFRVTIPPYMTVRSMKILVWLNGKMIR